MRVPVGLPEHHVADMEWLRDQMISYNAKAIFDKLYWEKTDSEDGWAMRGPWAPRPDGYQHVDVAAEKYAALREVCEVTQKVSLHRLVSTMMYPTPPGVPGDNSDGPTVHHVDEDKLNCAPANLTIITGNENISESRPYGIGFCNQHGHPLVGANMKLRMDGKVQCRWCKNESDRRIAYRDGRSKAYTPMPNFWLWMMNQYADAPDPELAMYRDTGLLVPVVI